MSYIEINGTRYEAQDFQKNTADSTWDFRKTCTVSLKIDYELIKELFVEDMEWFLITDGFEEKIIIDENGDEITVTEPTEYYSDLSAYSVVGDIIIHNNGIITVIMGMPTAEELLAILLGE